MSDDLIRLVYRSDAKISHEDNVALSKILRVSVSYNRQASITGCLAMPDRRFVQVLEGNRREVGALFHRIRTDSRHENITLLGEWPITGRLFLGWAMAFSDPTPLDQQSFRIITETGCGSQVIGILFALAAQDDKLYSIGI